MLKTISMALVAVTATTKPLNQTHILRDLDKHTHLEISSLDTCGESCMKKGLDQLQHLIGQGQDVDYWYTLQELKQISKDLKIETPSLAKILDALSNFILKKNNKIKFHLSQTCHLPRIHHLHIHAIHQSPDAISGVLAQDKGPIIYTGKTNEESIKKDHHEWFIGQHKLEHNRLLQTPGLNLVIFRGGQPHKSPFYSGCRAFIAFITVPE